MNSPKVVVYGASGYTGKHLAWKLAERKIPFIAAGRNKERLEKQLGAMEELQGAEYEVVAVEHTKEALTKLFTGKKVVHNLVGPYMQLGKPVVEAALAAGCHYLDCTGEQDWMFLLKAEYSQRFADKGLALLPATSAMWNLGLMVAEKVLETDGIDSLDITYTLSGVPSVSSTLSFMRMCCQPQYRLQNNQREAWPIEGVNMVVPGIHEVLMALPWSGGGESVWLEDDKRVINCSTLVTFRNQALMNLVISRMKEFTSDYQHRSAQEQEEATNRWAMEIAPQGEPPREDFDIHRGLITCHGRGRTTMRSVSLPGVAFGYVGTASMGAQVIDTLLRGQQRAVGMVPAAYVVGVRELHAELVSQKVAGDMVDIIR
ncbi:trans-acting enoyl reductase family protein [Candidatus Thalassolituus haligoni]|uniref:saccharopine dehydrogenase family protein n=1 Tax=Candidatus Thalassolituus haligoni TaxID=3100113 RepID=UPI0035194C8E|tara:strand:- start:34439 stop:35557 length:1119 start_codon:yes stop_codon:yes gene_type:complete